ncbi:MAG: hypothetical protein QGH41_01225, partial [Roseibacillus sp.]|nr:hypothetical protein [Roseibacillus sp.]
DNGTNGRLQQITVRVTTGDNPDLAARNYVDVANLSVQIFGEAAAAPAGKPRAFGRQPHRRRPRSR